MIWFFGIPLLPESKAQSFFVEQILLDLEQEPPIREAVYEGQLPEMFDDRAERSHEFSSFYSFVRRHEKELRKIEYVKIPFGRRCIAPEWGRQLGILQLFRDMFVLHDDTVHFVEGRAEHAGNAQNLLEAGVVRHPFSERRRCGSRRKQSHDFGL